MQRIKLLPSASSSVSFQRSRSSMYRAPRFERGGCRRESCRECQFTGMWLNPNSRGSRLRIWQPWGCNSLHAHHFTAPGLRGNSRPQRLKIAEPSGCKSWGADRRVVNREQQTGSAQTRTALGVQVSPRRPIWNAVDLHHLPEGTHCLANRPGALVRWTFQNGRRGETCTPKAVRF